MPDFETALRAHILQINHVVAEMERGVPAHGNRVLDTLVGRAALRMHSQGALDRLAMLSRSSQVIVDSYRLDANRAANSNDAPVYRCSELGSVEWNVAP